MNFLTFLQYDAADGISSGAAAGMGFGMILFYLILMLFYGFCYYKIFQKAGVENAWAGFIPIYNSIVLLQITKLPTWYIILFFIPFANIYAAWMMLQNLAKGFGKETPLYTILLLLFGFVLIPVLAFGSDKFDSKLIPEPTA
ncbi:MAG: hypothetical protein KBS61_08195 [Chryseobacterium sp.]|nr:hypothetical protein [Candidatus Chryseobacterium enterohippi]